MGNLENYVKHSNIKRISLRWMVPRLLYSDGTDSYKFSEMSQITLTQWMKKD